MVQPKVASNILERIRKCLNLADVSKGATEAEAIAAAAAAKKLMAEHNLNMSDVELKEEVAAGANVAMDTSPRKNKQVWEKYMARVADALFGTKHYYTSAMRDKDKCYVPRVQFVGVGQDASVAAAAYTILIKIVGEMGYRTGYKGRQYTSYCLGVADTLNARAQDAVRDLTPVQEETCKGIMVLKNQVILTHMKTLNLRPARSSGTSINGQAYAHGKADGKGVNLSFRNALGGN